MSTPGSPAGGLRSKEYPGESRDPVLRWRNTATSTSWRAGATAPCTQACTSDLPGRVWQHREAAADGFTKRYECKTLVWFEAHDSLDEARLRELRINEWKRAWKLELIEALNPNWEDLYPSLF